MKKILLLAAVLVLAGAAVGFYMYNKPHQDMERAEADMAIQASELYDAFEQDENAANERYLDKVVQVKGKVKSVSKADDGSVSLTLESGSDMFGVICEFDKLTEHAETTFETGQEVTLKGICTGKLMDVVLVRCVKV